jgi:CheY-like chemotaxis protein
MRPRLDRILDYREFPVLYVDDEPENLRVFDLTFKREFEIVTASSGEEAIEKLHSHPIAVILSDHRMPGMSGVEFLTRAHDVDPKSLRILVTAYGDADTLREAVNHGSIYKFVPKPWQPDEMRMTVRRAIEAYALDREREQLVGELGLLNRVAKSLTQELEMDRLIDLLLRTLTDELGYDGAGILFFDASERTLGGGRFLPADDSVAESLRELTISEERAPGFLHRVRDGEVQRLSVDEAFRQGSGDRGAGGGQPPRRARLQRRRPDAARRALPPGRHRAAERASGRGSAPFPGAGAPRRPARDPRDAGRGPGPRDQQSAGLDPHVPEHGSGEA